MDSRARTHLANERTFLAWLQTGIALTVAGVFDGIFLTGILAVLLAAVIVHFFHGSVHFFHGSVHFFHGSRESVKMHRNVHK